MDEQNTRSVEPVIPLPNVGEGGPVYSGQTNPVVVPVIPLPDVGEGGPVYSGTPVAVQTSAMTAMRFFNAAYDYPSFRVYVDGRRVAGVLAPGQATGYVRTLAGRHLISVRGADGYVFAEQTINFPALTTSTIAIAQCTGGLNLVRVEDAISVV